ncbi:MULTISPECIES: hypothetical protein [Burkholderia]|uniref:Uncharacterized protein n=1 Tax=Burkholderia contaminans TaxID=488447 RepID=A0A3N8QEA5_9BURK|nr:MULTISPECIES: hypothetical protein [Burkholderia]MDD1494063.1 hypothetical protein [Burkholderia thailandensis]RQT22137.1 hypothetical protein DF037_28945 [Burkholderia contaminans]
MGFLIELRGRTVWLIRSCEDGTTDQVKRTTLGTFFLPSGPFEPLLAQLSVDERETLQRWLDARTQAVSRKPKTRTRGMCP